MTVDGSELRRTHQLRLVVYPMIYDEFYHHPQVVGLGISSINTRWWFPMCFMFTPILGVSCSKIDLRIFFRLVGCSTTNCSKSTLVGTNISPKKSRHFESMIFPTSRLVGYVNFLEGMSKIIRLVFLGGPKIASFASFSAT